MRSQPFLQQERSEDDEIEVLGDELMSKAEFDLYYGDSNRTKKRDALADASYYWPNGRIHYIIDESLSSVESQIMKAIKEWDTWTCLKFIKVTESSSKYRWVRVRLVIFIQQFYEK